MLNTKHIQAIAEIDTTTLQFYLEKQGFDYMGACSQGELSWDVYRSISQGYEIDVVYDGSKITSNRFKEIRVKEI